MCHLASFPVPAFGLVIEGKNSNAISEGRNKTDIYTNALNLFTISKQTLSTLNDAGQLESFYDSLSVLMKLDLGASRLEKYYALQENEIVNATHDFIDLVKEIFPGYIIDRNTSFRSAISESIAFLEYKSLEKTGEEIYNCLCNLYIHKRILVGQPVPTSNGNNNIRIALG